MSGRSTLHWTRTGRVARFLAVLAVAILSAAALGPITPSDVTAAPSDWSPPRTVYIPQTGQTIDRVFLDFWRTNNGAANYGYPITPELEEKGHIVQYYQYARFEYWPEDPDGNVVQLGAIGQELRPQVLLRTASVVATDTAQTDTSNELAKMERAWLPLDKKTASQKNTDTWRYVPETRHSIQFGFKTIWEATGEADYLGNPLTEEYVLKGVTYQVFERGQLAWKKTKDPWVVALGEHLAKRYKLNTAPQDQGDIPTYDEALWIPPVDDLGAPGPPSGGGRSIVVSLSQQMLWAYEDETAVLSTLVSTGKEGFETPTGLFYINTEIEVQDMEGVIGGEYYNVPGVPWVMYFTDVGHALHGAYWHNDFGTPRSHGCVNLPMDVAEWMYGWADIGTPVLIVP